MEANTKYTIEKNGPTVGSNQVKHYGNSPYVVKKTQKARETLQKFPVPEKYLK